MKSKFFMAGILSVALVFGMMAAGCSNDSGDDSGNGAGGGGNAFIITVKGLTNWAGQEVEISFAHGFNEATNTPTNASGYREQKGTVGSDGTVSVTFKIASQQFQGFADSKKPVLILLCSPINTSMFGLPSKVPVEFGAKTVELTYPGDFQ